MQGAIQVVEVDILQIQPLTSVNNAIQIVTNVQEQGINFIINITTII